MLGICLCLEISFPLADWMCTLFCLSICVVWRLTKPAAVSVPRGKEVRYFTCGTRSMHKDLLAVGEITIEADLALCLGE